jgi:hypothetical protein
VLYRGFGAVVARRAVLGGTFFLSVGRRQTISFNVVTLSGSILTLEPGFLVEFACTVQHSLLVIFIRREDAFWVKLLDLLGCLGVSSPIVVNTASIELVGLGDVVVNEHFRFGGKLLHILESVDDAGGVVDEDGDSTVDRVSQVSSHVACGSWR